MKETTEIIIESSNSNGPLTAHEKDILLLERVEKLMNTGPIIGEGRDILLSLSRNLAVRDIYLDSMGLDIKKRQMVFKSIIKMMDKNDEEILKQRKDRGKL